MIAAKQGADAAKALTGDIYVRRWTTVRGKGKKATPVEHEVRVNAVSGAAIAVGAGLTAVTGMLALWLAQRKLTSTVGKTVTMRCRATPTGGKDAEGKRTVILRYYRGSIPVGIAYEKVAWDVEGAISVAASVAKGLETHLPSKYDWTLDTSKVLQRDGFADFLRVYSTSQGKSYGHGERSGFKIGL